MEKKIEIRKATEQDTNGILEMIKRLKKLNEEFDTRFTVSPELEKRAGKHIGDAIRDTDHYILLVAVANGEIAGFVKIDVIERIFYTPDREGRITEFYVMPEYRRKGLGKILLERAYLSMHNRKIGLITAEFPSLNLIALNFYRKDGFKDLTSIYGKEMEDSGI